MISLTFSQENFAEQESLSVHQTHPGQGREVDTAAKHHRLLPLPAWLVGHGEVLLHDDVDVL